MTSPEHEVYNNQFYGRASDWASKSAQVIVPLIIELLKPTSVVDVGCGDGTWLTAFRERGVTDVLGIDGDHVRGDILKIPLDLFMPHDLNAPLHLDRSFDVAICLEVAEHLLEPSAATLVASLARLSDVVVFSAAIPFQPGDQHINLRWPEYWIALFSENGYSVISSLKYKTWDDQRVAFFYKQNVLLFVKASRLQRDRTLRQEYEYYKDLPLAMVHPELYTMLARRASRSQDEVTFLNIVLTRAKRILRRLVKLFSRTQ